MTTDRLESQKRPWYLKKTSVYIMCLVFLPLGIINVLVHRKYWPADELIRYKGVILFLSFFWVMGFLPDQWSGPAYVIILIALLVFGSFELLRRK